MNKQAFLKRLGAALSGLPRADAEERLAFYEEMIDDRMEEGLSEEAAVAEIGPVESVAAQIVEETPLPKIVRERMKPRRRLRAWEIVLLVLGSPIWLTLGIAAAAVLLAVYVVLWALVLALWAVDVAMLIAAFGYLTMGISFFREGNWNGGLQLLACCLVAGGLFLLLLPACVAATKGTAKLLKKIVLGIKSLFLRKESNV